MFPLTPLTVGVGGALKEADGNRFEAVEGEGDVCEGCIPFVWTAGGGGGRFILPCWWGAEGLAAITVAILPQP